MLRQIEYAGRNCYRSHDKITDDSAPAFVRSLIRRGHLAPLEFVDMSVELITSRDVMAELTRHRLASLPNSTATHIVMKANIREWRHIFSLRLGKGVYPEMRELMELL